jgi:predicted kinase
VVLVGLPGSGKSTLRNALFPDGDYVVVSTDDIITEIAEHRGETYNECFKPYIGIAEFVAREQFARAIREERSIVWDQTNLTVNKRNRILSQVPKSYLKVGVYVEVSEERRQARILDRPGKNIPKHVDDNMMASYVRPSEIDEDFDFVFSSDVYTVLTLLYPWNDRNNKRR